MTDDIWTAWRDGGRDRFWATQGRVSLVEMEISALHALTAGNPGGRPYHLSRNMQARIGEMIEALRKIQSEALPCPDEAESKREAA